MTILCVAKKNLKPKIQQKNLWLPPDLVKQLDATVERINRTARPKTTQSEIGRIAIEELLARGEDGVRKLLIERRAGSIGRAEDADQVVDDARAPGGDGRQAG